MPELEMSPTFTFANTGLSPNCFQSGKFKRKRQKIRENQGTFQFLIVSFQSSDFLHAQLCIQLSMIVAKFYLFVYHPVLCSHFGPQFRFVVKPKSVRPKRLKVSRSSTSVQRNDKILIESCKNIRNVKGKWVAFH